MCAGGTSVSAEPLSKRTGMLDGSFGALSADSHFWWHRNVKEERKGMTWGTRSGREVKVFSSMRAVILDGFRLARSMDAAPPMDWPYRSWG